MNIRVALVDDHAMMRAGYRSILDKEDDFTVVAEGESGEDALRIVREHKPDVLILDVSMPGLSGVEVTQRLKKMESPTRVVIVTMHGMGPLPRILLNAGASAFVTKAGDPAELMKALRCLARGQRFVSESIAQPLALANATGEVSPLDKLTARELEVALMFGRGERAFQIAERLHLSEKTISTYKTRIYEKLGVHSEAELALLLVRYGLLAG